MWRPRPYQLKKVRRFFTLYFIPIIPLDTLGEFVECQVRKGTYLKQVLEYDSEAQAQRTESELRKAIRRVMVRMILADSRIHEKELQTICALSEKLTGHPLVPYRCDHRPLYKKRQASTFAITCCDPPDC